MVKEFGMRSDKDPQSRFHYIVDNQEYIDPESGVEYSGQWMLLNEKDGRVGRGIQIWPDGSVYEGYWWDNMANGIGRFIHSEGDVYMGNWVNDMSQGYGVYYHLNGTVYEGDWYQDK